jgi:hypothetical protein
MHELKRGIETLRVVELSDFARRVERSPCTHGDLEAMNFRRISMSDFRAAVSEIVKGPKTAL